MSVLLNIEKISKQYNQRVILEDVSFTVLEKQKIGLIGRNGAGKSTLLRILLKQEQADEGTVRISSDTRLGYIEQHEKIDGEQTAMEFLETSTGKLSWQCAKVASRFEIKPIQLDQKMSALSGGYHMRLRLASMLLKEPNLFLLDEPTNYLDVHTQILLEKFLQTYNGAFIIVSHDREFLKRTCEETLEIESGDFIFYPRPIDEYLEYKKERLAYALNYNKKVEREKKHMQEFVDRFRYKASKAKSAQSKMKAIAKLETIAIDDPLSTVHIRIPNVEEKKGILFQSKDLSIGYEEKVIASDINLDIERKEKVAIIGDNGQGKTTLLKTLALVLPPIDGKFKWAPDTKIAYYAQHIPAELNGDETVWGYLRGRTEGEILDEEIKRMAGNFLFKKDDLEKKIAVLSGGERARLCLAGLLLSKSNVMLLDEPTNHLDFETVEALGRALRDFNGTVIFISHNRTFVNSIATMVVEVKDGNVRRYFGSYEDYVYSLENSSSAQKKKEEVPQSEERIEIKEEEKEQKIELRKALKVIEEEIVVLEREKRKFLQKQEKNPQRFGHEDYEKIGEIVKQLEKKEEEWYEISAKVRK